MIHCFVVIDEELSIVIFSKIDVPWFIVLLDEHIKMRSRLIIHLRDVIMVLRKVTIRLTKKDITELRLISQDEIQGKDFLFRPIRIG